MAHIDPSSEGVVSVEQLEVRSDWRQFSNCSSISRVAFDEVLPVCRVASVCRVREHDLAFLCRPADMIKVEVGEDDICDVRWLDAEIKEAGE